MNDLNPVGAGVPPLNKPPLITRPLPLGDDPEESKPIPSALVAVEAILRQPRRVMFQLRQPQPGKLIFSMLFVAVICAIIYGLVMGTFSKGSQLWAVPLKVAIGMLISGLICLPSLYIFSCLSGSKARLSEIFGLLSGLLLLMTLLLVGFAPVAWLFSESTRSLPGWARFTSFFGSSPPASGCVSWPPAFPIPRRVPPPVCSPGLSSSCS